MPRTANNPWMQLAPFALLLFILPFPGTVTLRLAALAAGMLACAWSWHRHGFPQVPAKFALLFWAGCALLSLATAVDFDYSLGEIKNEIGYTMAAYLGFVTVTRTRAHAGFLVMALILGSLVLPALALWGYVFSDAAYWNDRGLAGGPGSYSTYLLALLPTLLWAGSVLRHPQRWTLVAGLIGLQLVVAALAGQRTFWLVFAPQVLLALYLLRARGFIAMPASRARAFGAFAVLLSAVAVTGAAVKRDMVDWTDDPRLSTWPAVAERILEHPLVGKGLGREVMKKAYPDLRPRENPEVWHAHNVFLNYGLSMGIPGMIAILALFFTLLRTFWQISHDEDRVISMAGICGVLLVLGVVGRNLTNDFFVRDLSLLFWSITGILLGYAQHAAGKPEAVARGDAAA